jgi:hypothetical protein
MPYADTWTELRPALLAAALSWAAGRYDHSIASLRAAENLLARLPADQEVTARLAAATIQFGVARRAADLPATMTAVARAEALIGSVPAEILGRHPEARARVLLGRGVVGLWSGRFDDAAGVLEEAAQAAAGHAPERSACLGYLALAEALRGRPGRRARRGRRGTGARPLPEPRGAAGPGLGAHRARRPGRGGPASRPAGRRPRRPPGQTARRAGLPGHGPPGRRAHGQADGGQGAGRLDGSALARAAAGPDRAPVACR